MVSVSCFLFTCLGFCLLSSKVFFPELTAIFVASTLWVFLSYQARSVCVRYYLYTKYTFIFGSVFLTGYTFVSVADWVCSGCSSVYICVLSIANLNLTYLLVMFRSSGFCFQNSDFNRRFGRRHTSFHSKKTLHVQRCSDSSAHVHLLCMYANFWVQPSGRFCSYEINVVSSQYFFSWVDFVPRVSVWVPVLCERKMSYKTLCVCVCVCVCVCEGETDRQTERERERETERGRDCSSARRHIFSTHIQSPSLGFRHLSSKLGHNWIRTTLNGHSLSPRSCPQTLSAPYKKFGY